MLYEVITGVPLAGRFVSLMRDSLMRLDFMPASPCPHEGVCPFAGLRGGKWCHFVFDTADAPKALHALSDEAGLSKDRAALSFVYAVSVITSYSIHYTKLYEQNHHIRESHLLKPVYIVRQALEF